MIKALQKIMLLISVTTVIGHSILPHLHHDEELAATGEQHHESSPGKHHHEDENDSDKHHEVFSFVQLDENFIPAKNLSKSYTPPVELTTVLHTITFADDLSLNTKTHYGGYEEYPPPNDHFRTLSFRGPPVA